MKEKINIEERKPVWISLSDFYLDIELQESDFKYIARKIIESPYSIMEVIEIIKYEIFPVLQPNLISIAGEWTGFQEEWLIMSITKSLDKRNSTKRFGVKCFWFIFKGMHNDDWEKLQKAYIELKIDTGSNT